LLAECVIRYDTLAVANVYQTVSSAKRSNAYQNRMTLYLLWKRQIRDRSIS